MISRTVNLGMSEARAQDVICLPLVRIDDIMRVSLQKRLYPVLER